ncbi:MAG: amidase family protein [Alphaproteobacteria bacterium]|jgi:amidase|nr:amidase family protein [Alphaproteobacteria bacterium]MDP6813450.1 amidase family protein [Alphaproteobacteria bacterium]
MSDDLIRLSAREAVARLTKGEISPLDLIEAAEGRIAAVEPEINALPTLCLERARDHARRLMDGEDRDAEDEPGWLAGLPVAIKDLMDVAGVRTTYGSPLFRDHVPDASHPLVARIERKGGIVIGKSNTPEFGAGGSTFNEVFGKTRNPWNTALTPAGSTGGGSAGLAAGEIWLAHGSDHGGSLRRPATYCSVVGLRPSPGRVTRGTVETLFSPLSVQGPMARTVGDVALFLDAMAGYCPHDPMTFPAPEQSFADAVDRPVAPRRVAFAETIGGSPVDRETREICRAAMRHFEDIGAVVEEISIDVDDLEATFLALRGQQFVIDRERQLESHRELIKADIIWNTEMGLQQSTSELARGERGRAALYRRFAELFETYDLLVTPGANTPAFDVDLRHPVAIDGVRLEHYLGASLLTAAVTLSASPALSLPCGFDQYGRPVGLQLVAPPRGEAALLAAGALYEERSGLAKEVPIDSRPGEVPPVAGVD